jgi:uncharacterized protein
MFVGVCRLTLHLRGIASLKQKRGVVRRVVDRTRSKFNAAVAEVSGNDDLRRAVVSAAVVGNSAAHVDSMMARIGSYVEHISPVPLADRATEVIPLGGDIGDEWAGFGEAEDDREAEEEW